MGADAHYFVSVCNLGDEVGGLKMLPQPCFTRCFNEDVARLNFVGFYCMELGVFGQFPASNFSEYFSNMDTIIVYHTCCVHSYGG